MVHRVKVSMMATIMFDMEIDIPPSLPDCEACIVVSEQAEHEIESLGVIPVELKNSAAFNMEVHPVISAIIEDIEAGYD